MKTTHAELVYQTLRYASETLAGGDIEAVLDLGFTVEQIARLAQLTLNDLRHLSQVRTHFLDVSVHVACFDRVLVHMDQNRHRESLYDELICQGASFPMLRAFTGMSNREFATRRRLLGMTGSGAGRPATPSEDDEQKLWNAWQSSSHLLHEERYLDASKTTGLPLSVIWSLINRWTAFDDTEARTTDTTVLPFRRLSAPHSETQ